MKKDMNLANITKPIPPIRPVMNLNLLLLSLIPINCVVPSRNIGNISIIPIKALIIVLNLVFHVNIKKISIVMYIPVHLAHTGK